MVLHSEADWVGLSKRVQKTKIYNLESDKFASTPPFSKNSVQLGDTFGGNSQPWVTFGGKIFKKTFGGKISKNIWRENIKRRFGGTILAGSFWQES